MWVQVIVFQELCISVFQLFPVLRELQCTTQKEAKFHKSNCEALTQAYVEQFLLAYMPVSKGIR